MATDVFKSHVDSLFSGDRGHNNLDIIQLGNTYAIDIFTFRIAGPKDAKEIVLSGLYRAGILNLLNEMGFFGKTVNGEDIFIHKDASIISEQIGDELRYALVQYVNSLPELTIKHKSAFNVYTSAAQKEVFLRQAPSLLTDNFFVYLDKDETTIKRDNRDFSFLFFENLILEIGKRGIREIQYSQEPELIWKDQIVKRRLGSRNGQKGEFEKFVDNVSNHDPLRIKCLRSALGYAQHHYHKPGGGQMIIFYDGKIVDLLTPQGGSGKGILATAITTLKKSVKIDGKQYKGAGKFDFQEISHDTAVLWIDDMAKNFDIDQLNSISTDGFHVEKKYKTSYKIPADEAPKIVISSNVILDSMGSTRKRRQFVIELSPYYSSKIIKGTETPIINEHGGAFFSNDWSYDEWTKYYWFMIDCSYEYQKSGLHYFEPSNTAENRIRQTIGDHLYEWITEEEFGEDIEHQTQTAYTDYKDLYEKDNGRYTQRIFSNQLKSYYRHKGHTITFSAKNIDGVKTSLFRISKT